MLFFFLNIHMVSPLWGGTSPPSQSKEWAESSQVFEVTSCACVWLRWCAKVQNSQIYLLTMLHQTVTQCVGLEGVNMGCVVLSSMICLQIERLFFFFLYVSEDGLVRRTWLSSSGRTRVEGGHPPLSQVACGTLGLLASECWPSSTRNSTADMWRWRRRRGRTSPHSAPPGTHHTSDRQAHTALPPPERKNRRHNPQFEPYFTWR